MKKVCTIILIIVMIITVLCPTIISHATLVVPADDATHYYLYNHIEFDTFDTSELLTNNNYNLYYDALNGADKTNFNINFTDNNSNRDALLNALVNTQNLNDTSAIYFYPITYQGSQIPYEDCKHILFYNNIGFATLMYYSPTDSEIVNVGNYFISDDPFVISYQAYSYNVSGDSVNVYYYTREVNLNSAYDSTNNFYYNYTLAVNFYGVLYSDIPCLFISDNSNYTNYNTPQKVYALYKQNDPLAIDRRPTQFINKIDGGGSQGTLGMLSGSFQQIYGGNSLSDSTLLTLFQLNNYADQNRYNVYLNFNYSFDVSGVYNAVPLEYHADYYTSNGMYDSYQVGSSNYLAVDMSKAYSRMSVRYSQEGDAVDQLGDINASLSSTRPVYQLSYTPIEALDIISKAGLQMYSTYDKTRTDVLEYDTGNEFLNWGNSLVNDLRCWIFGKPYETSVSQSHGVSNTTAYCKLRVTTFLSMGDQISSSIIYEYDFLNGTWSSTGSIDFDDGNEFDGYEYKNPIEDISNYNNGMQPSSYYNSGGYSNATGGSVGDITISVGSSQMIVDMTSEEWMKHSPNFAELITIIKNGITTVNEDSGSVVMLLSESYDVFPTPVWAYLSLAIAVIGSLSIIRYIRRG